MAVDLGPLGQQSLASTALIGVGAITIASIAFTTFRVLLSTFVLPGKSVCVFRGCHARSTRLMLTL